jgi:carbonic anhydrase
VIRNAGASAVDALRSIIISEQLLGTTEIILIKHTGCGMLTFKDEDAHGAVKKNIGEKAAKSIKGLKFLPFSDLETAVKDDLKFIRENDAVPEGITISGWVYEVETGKVRKVE